jgi:hypothetical protein
VQNTPLIVKNAMGIPSFCEEVAPHLYERREHVTVCSKLLLGPSLGGVDEVSVANNPVLL